MRFALHYLLNLLSLLNLLAGGFVALRFGWPPRRFGFGWPPFGFGQVTVAAPCSSSPRPGPRRRRRPHCPRHPRPLTWPSLDTAVDFVARPFQRSQPRTHRTGRRRSPSARAAAGRPEGSKTAAGTTPSGACATRRRCRPSRTLSRVVVGVVASVSSRIDSGVSDGR